MSQETKVTRAVRSDRYNARQLTYPGRVALWLVSFDMS